MNNVVKYSMYITIISIVLIIGLTMLNRGTTVYNDSNTKTATIVNEIIPYEIEYVTDPNLPSTAKEVVIENGTPGLSYTYDGIKYTTITTAKNKVVKVGSGKSGEYTGRLTGYGPDCAGCSAVGNVSCRTRDGKKHSLVNDGVYYNDNLYGEVRILAAETSVFPCGTIVKINNGIMDEFYGVVLDTGYSMRKAWNEGTVWMDVAFPTEKASGITKATSKNTKFSVQRWGW